MGKFRVRLKVENFELEVEGSREDMPLIADRVGQQFAGLLQPATEIVVGDSVADHNGSAAQVVTAPAAGDGKRKSMRRRRATATATIAGNGSENVGDDAVTWRHDTGKWGTPKQEWSVGKKIIYLLYVAKQEANQSEMTGRSIVATFNKHFKSAGMLRSKHINGELERLKDRALAPVSEDVTKTPSMWFLTQQGDKEAANLINDALGRGAVATPTPADVSSAGAGA